MTETSLLNAKCIPYDYNEEKSELQHVLKQAREIHEIQSELASLINIQHDDITTISTSVENTVYSANEANRQLELASNKKHRFKPIMIGTVIGGICTIPIVATAGISSGVIGYIIGGGSLLGGIVGKKLAR